jgi:hypothetical protein
MDALRAEETNFLGGLVVLVAELIFVHAWSISPANVRAAADVSNE